MQVKWRNSRSGWYVMSSVPRELRRVNGGPIGSNPLVLKVGETQFQASSNLQQIAT